MCSRILVVALHAAAVLALGPPVGAQSSQGREGWVVLPVEEYRALRAKAHPPEREPEPEPAPPVEAAVSRLNYELRVVDDAAVGEARLTVDVFKDGWVRIPIPAGLVVREARLDGRPVSLVSEAASKAGGTGGTHVLLSRPGRALLALDLAAPVTSAAGSETLPPAPTALGRAAVVIPRPGIDVAVTGGIVVERSEGAQETRLVASVQPGSRLALTWRRKADERRSRLPLRLRGQVASFVGLSEEAAVVSAEVRVEVVQGVAWGLTVGLPEGFVVNQLSGP